MPQEERPSWRIKSLTEEEAEALCAESECVREKYGYLNSAVIEEFARRKNTLWHGYLEWDDEVAGREFRKQQIRRYLPQIKVLTQGVSAPAYRSVVRIIETAKGPTEICDWQSMVTLVSDDENRERLERNLVHWVLGRREEFVLYGADRPEAKRFLRALDAYVAAVG